MKKLILLAMTVLSLNSQAQVLKTVESDEAQVPVASVWDLQNVEVGFNLTANFTTVFVGSAYGLSNLYVTFGASLEDATYTYKFEQLIQAPANIQVVEVSDTEYTITFDTVVLDTTTDDGGIEKTFTLVVKTDGAIEVLSVEQK